MATDPFPFFADSPIILFIQPEFQDDPMPLFNLRQKSRVLDLKKKLEHCWHWLRYFNYQMHVQGRILENDEIIGRYGIKDRSVVMLKVISANENPEGMLLVYRIYY